MKRKFVSFAALTMALTLAFGMTVSAAGSTSTASSNVTQATLDAAAASAGSSAVVDDKGNKVEAAVEATVISRENVGAAEQAAGTKLSSENLQQKEGGLVTGFDLKVTLADGQEAKNVKIQLAVPGVEEGHDYRVLHWTGSEWEVLKPVVAKGSLTVTFGSLSPIVIIEVAAKDTGSNSGGDSGNSGNSGASAPAADVSPKTGETLPMAGTAVLLCLAGAAVCARKARI